MTQAESKNTEWTPGPWSVSDPGDYTDYESIVILGDNDDVRVAVVHWHPRSPYRAGCEANARLIAAAPDLVEALRQAVKALDRAIPQLDFDDDRGVARSALLAARAALAKLEPGHD